jgi:hypothetical protein
MALRPVGFATARVALHRGARSRGYKLSREGVGPKSLEWWWWWWVQSVRFRLLFDLVSFPLTLALTPIL